MIQKLTRILAKKGVEDPESAARRIANEVVIKGRLSNYSLLAFRHWARKNLEDDREEEAIQFDALLEALSQTGYVPEATVLTVFSKKKRVFTVFADGENVLTSVMDGSISYGFHDSNMVSEMYLESKDYFTPETTLEIKVHNPEKRTWVTIPMSIKYRTGVADQGSPPRKTTTK